MHQTYRIHDTLVAIVQNVDVPRGICNECEEEIGAIALCLLLLNCCTNLISKGYRLMNQMDFSRFCRNILHTAFRSGSDQPRRNVIKVILHVFFPPIAALSFLPTPCKKNTEETRQKKTLKQIKQKAKLGNHHSPRALAPMMWEGILKVLVSANWSSIKQPGKKKNKQTAPLH